MYDKTTIMFEMLKTAGMLYEVRHGGPNKLIDAMSRFNNATVYEEEDFDDQDFINEWPETPETMIREYLEHTYNGADIPRWMEKIEKSKHKA
jgi:hypothetical protein